MTDDPRQAAGAAPDRVVFRTSRAKVFLMSLACLAVVALGVLLATRSAWQARAAGWGAIVVFGLFGAAGVCNLVAGGPRLILDGRGVEDVRSGMGPILWQDVLAVEVHELERQKFLSLRLRDAGKYLSRLRGPGKRLAEANMKLGFGDYTLPSAGLNASFEQIRQAVEQRCRAPGSEDKAPPGPASA